MHCGCVGGRWDESEEEVRRRREREVGWEERDNDRKYVMFCPGGIHKSQKCDAAADAKR